MKPSVLVIGPANDEVGHLREALQECGAAVVHLGCVSAAHDLAEVPDLVFMYHGPKANRCPKQCVGLRLNKGFSKVPVVLVAPRSVSRKEAIDCDAYGILRMPIEPAMVANVVMNLTRRPRYN